MRPIRLRVSDAHQHRHLARVEKTFEGAHMGVECDPVVHRDYILAAKSHARTIVVIQSVLVGYDRVQVVVATRELEDDQILCSAVPIVAIRCHFLSPAHLCGVFRINSTGSRVSKRSIGISRWPGPFLRPRSPAATDLMRDPQ